MRESAKRLPRRIAPRNDKKASRQKTMVFTLYRVTENRKLKVINFWKGENRKQKDCKSVFNFLRVMIRVRSSFGGQAGRGFYSAEFAGVGC